MPRDKEALRASKAQQISQTGQMVSPRLQPVNPEVIAPPQEGELRAVIYVRVSTVEQLKQYGPELQEDDCRAFCQRKGWTVAKVFVEAKSGKTATDRPVLEEAMKYMMQGKAEALVVYRFDRAARSVSDGARLLRALTDQGKHLVSSTEPIDTTSAIGKALGHILFVIAELERETILERTNKGRSKAASKGQYMNHNPPYGWQLNRKQQLEPNEEEMAVVQHCMNLRQGGYSLDDIAAKLNALGVPTRRAGRLTTTGKLVRGTWHREQVRRMMQAVQKYGAHLIPEIGQDWRKVKPTKPRKDDLLTP